MIKSYTKIKADINFFQREYSIVPCHNTFVKEFGFRSGLKFKDQKFWEN